MHFLHVSSVRIVLISKEMFYKCRRLHALIHCIESFQEAVKSKNFKLFKTQIVLPFQTLLQNQVNLVKWLTFFLLEID